MIDAEAPITDPILSWCTPSSSLPLLSDRSCCPNLAAVDAEATDGSRRVWLLELTLLLLQHMMVLASRLHDVLAWAPALPLVFALPLTLTSLLIPLGWLHSSRDQPERCHVDIRSTGYARTILPQRPALGDIACLLKLIAGPLCMPGSTPHHSAST